MKTVSELVREAEDRVIANQDLDWKREFAELIRADEREICAKVCDELRGINWGPEQCATAIRARSKL